MAGKLTTFFISAAIVLSVSQHASSSYITKSRFYGKFECKPDVYGGYRYNTQERLKVMEFMPDRKFYLAHISTFGTGAARAYLKYFGYGNASGLSHDKAMVALEKHRLSAGSSPSSPKIWEEAGSFYVEPDEDPTKMSWEYTLIAPTMPCETTSFAAHNFLNCKNSSEIFKWDMGTMRFTYVNTGNYNNQKQSGIRVKGASAMHGTCVQSK